MSLNDLRLFEAIASDHLMNYGYELENKQAVASNFDHFWHGNVISPLKKFLAMIKNSKGHRDSLIKIIIKTKLILRKTFVK